MLPQGLKFSKQVLNGTFILCRDRRWSERALMADGHAQTSRIPGHKVQPEGQCPEAWPGPWGGVPSLEALMSGAKGDA